MKITTLLLLASASMAVADVKLPAIFSDHLVLQRDVGVPVWGWAEPGEEVSISIGKQTQTAKTAADGKWTVKLDAMPSGGVHTLTVKGKNTLVVNDVLIGEVWLGSGQSNMALTVNQAKDVAKEKDVANLPEIRMFTVRSGASNTAQADCQGEWLVCSPQNVGGFSATLYFFGREIHKGLNAPVGLIHSSVGGTPIESWISPEAQQAAPELKAFFEMQSKQDGRVDPEKLKAVYEKQLAAWKVAVEQAKSEGKELPRRPRDPATVRERKGNVGGLFNGKIAPLIPYALRGIVWYQGEANSTPPKAPFYQYQLPLLIKDWRTRWGSELPFAWVQLPNFGGPGRDWPTVREAMLKTLSVPQTGMAITIDVGEEKDIHPKNKQDVGRRLALWALGKVYAKPGAVSGPLPAGHEVRGKEVVLKFSHTNGGLVAKDGPLRGFVVAGEDRQWKPAEARIEGESVIVSSPEVQEPRAVRYAWENFPSCNLYNRAELPASPFRTDDWPAAQ